jgi:proteasome accessory factor A
MQRVFGIETEYGITVDGRENVDVVSESIELVRSYTAHGAMMKWDYELEDPHRDARGFRVDHLLQDTDESAYFEVDRNRALSYEEIKSDLVLSNGARYYNDHAHPEYSTPECSTIQEIVAHDKAGERILAECALRRNHRLGGSQIVRIYKNNTDFQGHSYGCHDNYLMRRDVAWSDVVAGMLPFLVTRQIFAGAGKVGVESENGNATSERFQISQRSDFFSVLVSIDTMNRRPLVNTRDEPHADSSLFRRFHVIIGDSNMSEWATALKIGSTTLVLELIERNACPAIELAQPIDATKSISRDPTFQWIVELADGRKISAIDIQRIYLAAAREHLASAPGAEWILDEWETVLNDLSRAPLSCRDRVDWAAKRFLLDAFREAENVSWHDPWMQSLDLAYHNIDWEEGLYYALLNQGQMRRVVSEEQIKDAIFLPPDTTRAFFRGRSVARFNDSISSIQWDEIVFGCNGSPHRVKMPHPSNHPHIEHLNASMRSAENLDALVAALSRTSSDVVLG